nr:hypothetical protein BHE74_00049682 [Ipomoea batatas]
MKLSLSTRLYVHKMLDDECFSIVMIDNAYIRPIKFYLFGTEYHISVNELAKCLGVWDPESVVDDFPVAMDAKSYLNGANNTIELQKVKDAYERHLTRKDLKIVRRLCWGMGIEKELRGGSVIKRVMHFSMAELEMASIRPVTLPSEEEEPEEPTQASQIQSPLAPTPTMPAAAAGRPSSIMPERFPQDSNGSGKVLSSHEGKRYHRRSHSRMMMTWRIDPFYPITSISHELIPLSSWLQVLLIKTLENRAFGRIFEFPFGAMEFSPGDRGAEPKWLSVLPPDFVEDIFFCLWWISVSNKVSFLLARCFVSAILCLQVLIFSYDMTGIALLHLYPHSRRLFARFFYEFDFHSGWLTFLDDLVSRGRFGLVAFEGRSRAGESGKSGIGLIGCSGLAAFFDSGSWGVSVSVSCFKPHFVGLALGARATGGGFLLGDCLADKWFDALLSCCIYAAFSLQSLSWFGFSSFVWSFSCSSVRSCPFSPVSIPQISYVVVGGDGLRAVPTVYNQCGGGDDEFVCFIGLPFSVHVGPRLFCRAWVAQGNVVMGWRGHSRCIRGPARSAEFKLVLEVFEGGSDGIEALSFMNHRRVIFLIKSKLLHENEAGRLIVLPSGVLVGVGSRSLLRAVVEVQIVGLARLVDGAQEVSSGDGMDGVAELIVQIPDFLQHGFDLFLFFDFHFLFHGEGEQQNEETD